VVAVSLHLGLCVTALSARAGGTTATCRDEDGRVSTLEARCVVNASGPWSDQVRGLVGESRPILGLSRGAHLVLSGLALPVALLLPGAVRRHRLFAIPWRGATLFGTTDTADSGDPGRELPEVDDLRQLFREACRFFPDAGLTRRSVLSAFTGARPLLAGSGSTLSSSREHRVLDDGGLITIAGGKLTTWRTMALLTVDAVVRRLGRRIASPPELLEAPLPGGNDERPGLQSFLEDGLVRHADDIVFRRLPIGHDPEEARRALPDILDAMAARMGWNRDRIDTERARVTGRLDAMSARIDEALGPA
jgi:glycerol-3-phosphate dehydrogenase